MKRIGVVLVMAMLLLIGSRAFAATADTLREDMVMLIDLYASAAVAGDTSFFTSHFQSFMMSTNRLGKAAAAERKHHQLANEVNVIGFLYREGKAGKEMPGAVAEFEAKKAGKLLAKGTVVCLYSGELLKLVYVKFDDEVARYKDLENLDKLKEPTEKKQEPTVIGPLDFSTKKKELEI